VALALLGAGSTALALRDDGAEVAALSAEDEALLAHAKKFAPPVGLDAGATPFFEAKSITQAGAALQQRIEAAVAAARGRLISSKVDLGGRGDPRRVALSAELTIAEPDMQALLFDLETGRPYLFVDALEARAGEANGASAAAGLRVSLAVAGQWSGAK
jgi:general secretion pathway protein M